MAKIKVYFPESLENGKAVVDIYLQMINDILPRMYQLSDYNESLSLEKRQQRQQKDIDDSEWEISYDGKEININGPGVEITRKIYLEKSFLYHSFFELNLKLQNRKISDIVMRSSLELCDLLKIKKIGLNANLEVGGYAWFRKGALPTDQEFIDLVYEQLTYRYNTDIKKALYERVKNLTPDEIRIFVLSPEFSQYKKAFLGASWQAAFDPNDPVTRIAMVEGAEAAFEYVVKSKAVPAAVPLTSNQEIANELVKTQMRSIAFARSLAKNNAAVLNETEEKVYAILTSYASKFEGVTDLRSAKARSLFRQLEKELIAARETAWQEVNKNLTTELIVYSKGQIATSAAIIQTAVPVILDLYLPSKTTAELIVNATPFQGRLLSEWLKRTQNIDAARITAEAVRGITQGLTPTQIARSVVGTQALNGVDGVTRKALKDMESLMLTVTSGIQNEVRSETYKLNSDVFDKEYFIATLDIHTTLICAGNDGKIFKLGEGPMPPLHFRCRSLRGPYIDPDAFGTRPYKVAYEKQLLKEYAQKRGLLGKFESRAELPKGAKTDYDNFARARTRELVGKLPALTNFNSFLKMQSESFQDEYLGKARAAAFRRGEFNLENFTNSSGRVYTNTELGLTS